MIIFPQKVSNAMQMIKDSFFQLFILLFFAFKMFLHVFLFGPMETGNTHGTISS